MYLKYYTFTRVSRLWKLDQSLPCANMTNSIAYSLKSSKAPKGPRGHGVWNALCLDSAAQAQVKGDF